MNAKRRGGYSKGRYPRYVSVAERKQKAANAAKKMRNVQPVVIEGRKIAHSFWGKAWCHHLEQFSDFSNRLPRGRSYVRNGSVIDLKIAPGTITASVAGSSVYKINIKISPIPKERWEFIKDQCAGGIGSALELLQGKISDQVMQTVCNRDNGLFPHPVDIKLDCNCPDWASLCKHLAAVLYGVAARLDQSPELLFVLRGVDPEELIGAELTFDTHANTGTILKGDLSKLFGVDIDQNFSPPVTSTRQSRKKVASKRSTKKKSATKVAQKRATQKKRAAKNQLHRVGSGISIARGLRASHLKKLRRHYLLSVDDLATLSGLSAATIQRWEKQTGVINTNHLSLELITQVFNLSHKQVIHQLGR